MRIGLISHITNRTHSVTQISQLRITAHHTVSEVFDAYQSCKHILYSEVAKHMLYLLTLVISWLNEIRMAYTLSHSKTISSVHSWSKGLSPCSVSTPSRISLRPVSRLSSAIKLGRNAEIDEPCLTKLLYWSYTARWWLYALTLFGVCVQEFQDVSEFVRYIPLSKRQF